MGKRAHSTCVLEGSRPRKAASRTLASVRVEGQKPLFPGTVQPAAARTWGGRQVWAGAPAALGGLLRASLVGPGWRRRGGGKRGCVRGLGLPPTSPRSHLPLYNWLPAGLPFLLSDPGRLAGGKPRRGGDSSERPGVGAEAGRGEGERLIERGTRREARETRAPPRTNSRRNLDLP